MSNWKFWVAIVFSLGVIVVFQNCSAVSNLKTSPVKNLPDQKNSADIAPHTK